jgi:hypothetical protein
MDEECLIATVAMRNFEPLDHLSKRLSEICGWSVASVDVSNHPELASGLLSKLGINGLISSNGVSSSISTPYMFRRVPSTLRSLTIEIPIGFGLEGALVEKSPCSLVSRNGLTYIFGAFAR